MGQTKFIEMVYVGNAKIERSHKDDSTRRDIGEKMQRDDRRPEDDFFSNGALELTQYTSTWR